jgi:hypothetical protein
VCDFTLIVTNVNMCIIYIDVTEKAIKEATSCLKCIFNTKVHMAFKNRKQLQHSVVALEVYKEMVSEYPAKIYIGTKIMTRAERDKAYAQRKQFPGSRSRQLAGATDSEVQEERSSQSLRYPPTKESPKQTLRK